MCRPTIEQITLVRLEDLDTDIKRETDSETARIGDSLCTYFHKCVGNRYKYNAIEAIPTRKS